MLKPTKKDQAETKGFEKTFLLEPKPDALSAAQAIKHMVELRGKVITDRKYYPLVQEEQTGNQISLTNSRRELAKIIEHARIPKALIKGHSLRIGGATAYDN